MSMWCEEILLGKSNEVWATKYRELVSNLGE